MATRPKTLEVQDLRILLSHPTGNQNVRQALRALQDAGLLEEFWTTVAYGESAKSQRFLPSPVVSELRRRSYDVDVLAKTSTQPFREIVRNIAQKTNIDWLTRHEVGLASVDRVTQSLDRRVARRIHRGGIDAVYAYEDGALETFRAARNRGMTCIYEHPVGYWRQLQRVLVEEADLQPEYQSILGGSTDSQEKRERKDEEISSADCIVVPSRFSAASLSEYPGSPPPIHVVNYGAPAPVKEVTAQGNRGPIRVLFVGSLQQRKGISYVVRSLETVGSAAVVTVIGSMIGKCAPLEQWLNKVEWIPRTSHEEVLSVMRRCDVLILPSLSEGFGLVVLEAMSQGLTVIVSENTGASDVVTDGIDGFVVPIRSAEAIVQRLERFIPEPDLLTEMKKAALDKARKRTWQHYRQDLLLAIGDLLVNEGKA